MQPMQSVGCAGLICALILTVPAPASAPAPAPASATAPPSVLAPAPAAARPLSGASTPSQQSPRAMIDVSPGEMRAQVRNGSLQVQVPLPPVAAPGRLSAQVLCLNGRVLGRGSQVVVASKEAQRVILRVPLSRRPDANADLWRISYGYQGQDGVAAQGIVGLSEILDMPFLSVRGQETLVAGSRAALRLVVADPRGTPLSNVEVTLHLVAGRRTLVARGTSAVAGDLHLSVDLPDSLAGTEARLAVEAVSGPFRRWYRTKVTIRREAQVLLTTDKPIYQPGQAMHLRVLALRQPSRRPLVERAVRFRLKDARGTLLAEARAKTDEFGVSFVELPISDGVRPGTFEVEAAVSTDGRHWVEAKRRVKIYRYEVPDFKVTIIPARDYAQPGSPVELTLTAQTLSGQPLGHAPVTLSSTLVVEETSGRVRRRCEAETERIMGRTDALGQWAVQVPMHRHGLLCGYPPNRLSLAAEVTAPGGLRQEVRRDLQVAHSRLQVAATPEAGTLVRGLPQRIYLQAAYPDGAPARAVFTVRVVGEGLPSVEVANEAARSPGASSQELASSPKGAAGIRTSGIMATGVRSTGARTAGTGTTGTRTLQVQADAQGLAVLKVTPHEETLYLTVIAKDHQGNRVSRSLDLRTAAPRVLVRPLAGMVTSGESLGLELVAPRHGGTVQVDLKQGAQTVHTATGRILGQEGRVEIRIPGEVDGLVGLAVRVGSSKDGWQEGLAPVLVRPARWLNVDVTPDKEVYKPGAAARLALRVTDEAGRGKEAAVGLRIVDEGVYLLAGSAAQSEHSELLLPALALKVVEPVSGWTLARAMQEPRVLVPGQVGHVLLARLQQGAWAMAEDSLVHNGAEDVPKYRRGLGRRLKERLAGYFGARFHRYAAVQRRAWLKEARTRVLCMGEHVSAEDPEDFVKRGELSKDFLVDPWGRALAFVIDGHFDRENRFRVTIHSLGPDGEKDTEDDLGAGPYWMNATAFRRNPRCGVGYGGGGVGLGGFEARLPRVFMGRASVHGSLSIGAMGRWLSDSPAPRTRRDFRETLAVFPALRTRSDGSLIVPLSLADNLTTWTITATASDRDGRLGGRVARMRTSQPFSVDVRIPPRLTRGDEITARVVVRNELSTPQTVQVSLRAAGWYEGVLSQRPGLKLTTGDTGLRAEMERRSERVLEEIRVVGPKSAVELPFGIRVTQLGQHELHVTAQSPLLSDAVARPVLVEAEGVEERQGASGMLAGIRVHHLRLPESLVPDTTGVEVTLEPDVISSTWGSFEGLLRRPHGCFEQTSSTTYPNILVMRHLRQGKGSQAARKQAESFLAQGYQRLTTFEVGRSGGFSLFGHAPAQPMLSAFGLGQFHDLGTVMTVDRAIIRRVQRYLLSQQRADGSFRPEGSLIESGSQNPSKVVTATAYVALQLARSGYEGKPLVRALAVLKSRKEEAQGDPYFAALSIRALATGGSAADIALARRWAEALARSVHADGAARYWSPKGRSTFSGTGDAASVEVTALAIVALLQTGTRLDLIQPAVRWLLGRRGSYGAWSTTQATVLALEALLGARAMLAGPAPSRVHVLLDGERLGTLTPRPGARSVPVRLSVSRSLSPGSHRLELRPEGQGRALYRVALRYNAWETPRTQGAHASRVNFGVHWHKRLASPGDTVTVQMQVNNGLGRPMDAPMAEIGLPAGMRLLEGSLRRGVSEGLLSNWEKRGSRLLLYFTRLPAGGTTLPLHLAAEAPLSARIPPSRLYEYYRPDTSWYASAGHIQVRSQSMPSPSRSQVP